MSGKKSNFPDDEEDLSEHEKKEIARLRIGYAKFQALTSKPSEPGKEEEDLRRLMGNDNYERYLAARQRYSEGEMRRHGIKPPPARPPSPPAPRETAVPNSQSAIHNPQSATPPRRETAVPNPQPDYPEIMTIDQVADYLQLHPQVVYRHISAGTLPVSRIGRTIRVKKSILDAFLENGAWDSVRDFLKYLKTQGRIPHDAEKTSDMPSPAEPIRRNRFSADVD